SSSARAAAVRVARKSSAVMKEPIGRRELFKRITGARPKFVPDSLFGRRCSNGESGGCTPVLRSRPGSYNKNRSESEQMSSSRERCKYLIHKFQGLLGFRRRDDQRGSDAEDL